MKLLQEEAELEEIVRLVGIDALSQGKADLETARSIREDFLHQNAMHDVDTYTTVQKQLLMLDLILSYYQEALKLVEKDDIGLDLERLFSLPVRERIARAKYVPEERLTELESVYQEIKER